MTWLSRLRPAVYLLGVALILGSIAGARALTTGSSSTEAPETASATSKVRAGGPVVLGTVDTDSPPVSHGLPPVLQSGTVAEVFVKNGQLVKEGDKLYSFDTSIQTRDLERAQVALELAQQKVAEAQDGIKRHGKSVEVMNQGVAAAEVEEQLQGKHYNLVKSNIESGWRTQNKNITTDELAIKLKDDPILYKANVDYAISLSKLGLKKAELEALEAAKATTQLMLKAAEIGVRQAEAEIAKAQTAIDLCTIKASGSGTIEQITINRGSTLGVSTRSPALWFIPAGPRIVRAEVEAEFAHSIGKDLEGKEVTIYDHSDAKLTYKGIVRRVGGTFLFKRSGNEGLMGNETRVLETEVEVVDPQPTGKPPLRVGQRVRVNLGR